MKHYCVGIDFGTLSARALLIDMRTGAETAVSEFVYPHKILDSSFFEGITLGKAAALQHPQDYLDATDYTMHDLLQKSGIQAEEICGIGMDFTSSTVLPVTEDGTPLCFLEEFRNEPHAYVKLWKHHGGQAEADEIDELARKTDGLNLERYGMKVSSEWAMPKFYETLHKAPEVFHRTARFIEAADWLVWHLTGTETHNSCMAGYKTFWQKDSGYPSNEFWKKLHPEMGIIGTKISENVIPTGTKAGQINERGAALTGLAVGTPVAAPIIDAHAALPGAGIVDDGKLMMIIGTSGCHLMMGTRQFTDPGIYGSVPDGIIPGYIGYESGQSCVGDCFDWYIKNCVPESYTQEARNSGKNIYTLLNEKAQRLAVGESGVLVLDWWNGNRAPYADFDLTGMILGLTLKTKPEEIYRALIEATAFGTKTIVDTFRNNGIPIRQIYASGGISIKNPFLMQIYADVLGQDIFVTQGTQTVAKGSALFGSVVGGYFDTLAQAAAVISDKCDTVYHPNLENTHRYEGLYQDYLQLCRYFAKENNVMKRLLKY